MNHPAAAAPPGNASFRKVLETPVVRQRILDYLGGPRLEEATCQFLGRLDPLNPSRFERHPTTDLGVLLDEGCELARSFGDKSALLVHLDIEYVNFDDPAAAYTDPQRVFSLQEPLVAVIERHLRVLGIHYLHVVTGQGHHFVWRIRKNSPVARAISRLGICTTPELDPPEDPLFPGIGLLMEHLAHRIKPEAAAACAVPVEITARHVGPGRSGQREMLSIDISEYGDPLPSRMIRIPFTAYRKPWISGLIERLDLGSRVPAFFTLPLHEMGIHELIERRHLPETVVQLALRAAADIPLEEKGTKNLLDSYRRSGLTGFHQRFYARGHPVPTPAWSAGVEATIRELPPCARHVIEHPNDLLLKPSGMQLVTRCLLARGWPPRHIAAFVAAIFRDPAHHWNHHWDDYDPEMRAEFYVRLFAGEIDQRLERGVDFNCTSQQEKQFCWNPKDCSLTPFHARLYANPRPPETAPP